MFPYPPRPAWKPRVRLSSRPPLVRDDEPTLASGEAGFGPGDATSRTAERERLRFSMLPAPPRPVVNVWFSARPRRSAISASCSASSCASQMAWDLGSRLGERMLPAPPRPECLAWG
jgi:hypothetical protein